VNHCWVFDAEHHPIKLEKPHSPATSQPVGQFVLSAPPVAELRAALAGLPFGDEVSALVEETYQPGRTMGEAFSALLKRLLAHTVCCMSIPCRPPCANWPRRRFVPRWPPRRI
jgi:hypothetical protein